MTLERLTTGIAELDGVLRGGVPRYATVFVAGPPGSGKTVISQQALFANASRAIPSLYLGTLSEPVLKMIRHAQEFKFFVREMVGKDVLFSDIGDALKKGGGSALIEEIDRLVKLHRPEFLVIDSFKVIREHFSDTSLYREFISELVLRLATWQVTSFFVGEYTAAEIVSEPEFAVADGIIYMYGMEEPLRQRRFLRVMKMRGTAFFSGEHLFEVNGSGIDLYPRMDPGVVGEYSIPEGRVASTIPGLAEMTGGGLRGGSCALIAGVSGSGKTLCALSFLVGAASNGTPGLLVSFEERPEQLVGNADQFGWGVRELVERGVVEVIHVAPSELDLDKHGFVFRSRAKAVKAGIVVIDTISALEDADADGQRAHNYLWAITDYFKRMGVTVLLTYESIPTNSRIGLDSRLSFLADALIQLDAVNIGSTMRRTIQVRKMRGTNHDKSVREFIIDPAGIRVGEPFDGNYAPQGVAGLGRT